MGLYRVGGSGDIDLSSWGGVVWCKRCGIGIWASYTSFSVSVRYLAQLLRFVFFRVSVVFHNCLYP
jgi:hypothetical protein